MGQPLVVVVGLGPAGPDLMTAAAAEALSQPQRRFLRTARHPSAVVVEDATTFDSLYEREATFADVYREKSELFKSDDPLFVVGKLDIGEDQPKILRIRASPVRWPGSG